MLIVTTKVHDRLLEAYNSKAFNVYVLEGGSRSSKTHSIIQFWIKWALLNRGRNTRVAICRLKGTWLNATVLKDFIDVLTSYGLYNPKNHNKTNKIYKLYDTEFWFLGLDDPQKVHGFKSDAFWINEAVEAGYDDYSQLMQRCLGFAILDYNPSYEEHWIYDRILKRNRTYYNHSTMFDNQFNSKNVIEQISSYEPTDENRKNGTADERKWKIYGLGQRAAIEGLIFEFDYHWDIIKEVPEYIKEKHHRYGLDFGFTNDVTAIPDFYWSDATKEVWIDQLCYQTDMVNTDIGRVIKNNNLQNVKGYADCSEPKSIEEIHRMGINIHKVEKPQGSVNLGIDIMKRHKTHITERSINFIKEWRNYTWQQDKNGKWLNVPVDKDNHGIDATRYVYFMEKAEKSDIKVVSKSQLGFY